MRASQVLVRSILTAACMPIIASAQTIVFQENFDGGSGVGKFDSFMSRATGDGTFNANFNYGAFHVVAGVDNDPKKIGRRVSGFVVRAAADLAEVVRESGAEIGVLAVPAESAQENYEALADAGVKGVLNFAPVRVKRRADVPLKNVDLRINLEELAFFLR